MKLNFEFDRDVLICAVRYALTRSSYMVGTISDELKNNWKNLSPSDKELFKRDIKEHLRMYEKHMMKCDVDIWKKILELKVN